MRFQNFAEFYPYYLSEHADRTCRRLHFVGSALVLGILLAALLQRDARWLWAALPVGYGCAWVGHYVFEHNRPATFRFPLWSFIGDWAMFRDILVGRIPF